MLNPNLDGPLWAFALGVYLQPGVSDACVLLQDRFGADVNMLLFSAWMGAELSVELSADDLRTAEAQVREWHHEVVQPLRAIRRRMKTGPHPGPSQISEALRDKVKAVEILSERIELAALEAWATDRCERGNRPCDLALGEENVRRAVRHLARSDPDADAEAAIKVIADAARMLPNRISRQARDSA